MEPQTSSKPLVDLDLARRLERAEGVANAACVDAHRLRSPASGACWTEIAGTMAMFDGPDSPLTQTFGLGLFAEVHPKDLDALETFFFDREAPVHHEVCPLQDQAFMRSLGERGYRPLEWSNVLIRPIGQTDNRTDSGNPNLIARLIEPNERELWARLASRGWSQDAALTDYIFELSLIVAERDGSLCFLAELDGQPIATGSLFVHDGVALFAGASTIPESRGRGAQRALFAARLQYAHEHQCDLAMVVTQPGSLSDRNSQRSGFQTCYTRTKYLLPRR